MLRSISSLSLQTSDISRRKPIVIHHHNQLTMGGTEKMSQIFCRHFVKDNTFEHYVAYKKGVENTREPYFKEIVGSEKMLCYESPSELLSIIKEKKPFILHRYSAGIPEFPFVKEIKEHTRHFVSTAVFGNQDNTIDISKVIYVSKHIQWLAGTQDTKNHHVVRNPIESPYSTENLREELGIPEDAFVFGRIGRDDENHYVYKVNQYPTFLKNEKFEATIDSEINSLIPLAPSLPTARLHKQPDDNVLSPKKIVHNFLIL